MELNTTYYNNNSRIVTGTPIIYQDDVILLCDTSTGPVTINLLQIPDNEWLTTYKLYVIDNSSNASVNNITINAGIGQTINNQSSFVLSTDGECVIVRIVGNSQYTCTKYLRILDEGNVVTTDATSINFVGPNVTATSIGTEVTVTVSSQQAYDQIQDEGINLPQRTTLDFQGAGVTASDNGSKTIVTIPGSAITADNGLTASTPTNVQLGGALIQPLTTINVQTNKFVFSGTRNATDSILEISNNGTGGGLLTQSAGNNAIAAICSGTSSAGFFLNTSTGIGVQVQSNSNLSPAGTFTNLHTSVNTITDVLEITSNLFGAILPTAGIGSALFYRLPHITTLGARVLVNSNKIISTFTDVNEATLNSNLIFQGVNNGITLQDLVTFKGNGEVRLHAYGLGNFNNPPAFMLGVDALGNIVEV